ncbi:MAG TPA: PAS-domain containing protein [Alphaproteobacteria bacterium]|nr:PAS-domain containing protein [Alphaproteobacteria bacterium]
MTTVTPVPNSVAARDASRGERIRDTPRRLDPQRQIALFGGLVIAIIIGLAAGFLWHLRTATLNAARRDMSNLGAVLAEQTTQTIRSADLVLDSINERLRLLDAASRADQHVLHAMLQRRLAEVRQAKFADIVGADGTILASSRADPAPAIPLTNLPWFIYHRDHPAGGLVIADPARSRTDGEWLIMLSRRLDAADGSFAGVLVLALDPAYFETVYKAATMSDGTAITLSRRDGVMLARYPRDDNMIGRSFGRTPIFEQVEETQAAGGTVRYVSQIDGSVRYYAPRIVAGYPLVVAPSVAEAVVLRTWTREAVFVGGGAAAAVTGIFVLLMLLRANGERLHHQADILSTLIENLPIGASLVGPDLRHVAFNRPFLDTFDLTPEMLKPGDPFAKLIRYSAERGEYGPGDIEEQVRQRVARATEPRPDQFERKRPDGQVIEIRRMPLPVGGFVTTYIDVTEARRRERDLEEARASLEEQADELAATADKLNAARIEAERARSAADAANAAKSLFLANMSHELRTPLNAILGFSEVTRDAIIGPLDARYRDYARDVHSSGQYLLRLINDILDTSKIEVGRMELRNEPVDLDELVRECRRLLLEKAHDRGVTILTDIPQGLPWLMADRLRIKQIVLNLMSNAVKFTPSGGQVMVGARLTEERGGMEFTIADSGIGMKPEDIPVALEPFRQVDNTYARRYEGTGLGLPLSKHLAELHGGTLTVESEVNVGTKVTVWLPRERLGGEEGREAAG